MYNKKMIVCVSHFDDEFLGVISLLLSFVGTVYVIFTSEGDCISQEDYYRELKEFEAFTESIQRYREQSKLGPYIVEFYPTYGEVTRIGFSPEIHAKICKILENILIKDDIEYFIYPCLSTHQSHQQTNILAQSLLRIPYIFNIRHVLMCIYPPEHIYSIQDTIKDSAYQKINISEMDFIKQLYNCYANKLKNFPLEMIETGFRFIGTKINTAFAQSFFIKRMVL